jgi:homoserine O-acetyltransferase
MRANTAALCAISALPSIVSAQLPQKPPTLTWPQPTPGTFSPSNFTFSTGDHLSNLTLYYHTLGTLQTHANGSTNAILLLHGTTGSSDQFYVDGFAGTLFNRGQTLDVSKYYLIIPDMIGHGNSSKPSNTGLRGRFPKYQYVDMIAANHALLTQHLGVQHLRLVLGVSMGGMHTWMMGEQYPKFMDALLPIASLPTQVAGQNRLWRKFIIELIRSDPAWKEGEYTSPPVVSMSGALSLLQVMFSSAVDYYAKYPTRTAMDAFVDGLLPHVPEYDANDQLFAWNASYTYNAEPGLELIEAPLTAVNTADDLMNPPEPEILQWSVAKMKQGVGKAVVIPLSNETYGHGTYIKASVWKNELEMLLAATSGGE